MIYRYIRKKETGEFVNVVRTTSAEQFRVPKDSHIRSTADALGVTQESLEAIDSPTPINLTGAIEPPPGRQHWAFADQESGRAKFEALGLTESELSVLGIG